MKHLYKGIAVVLFYVIAAALLAYAASRSLDFITKTLPPEQQAIGYLALAATSGGAIAWLMVFLYAAKGTGQKVTAALMVGIDLAGEFALFTFDTLLTSGQNGITATLPPEDVQMVIVGLSALIAANILATFAYHITEPENARDMREAAVREDLENKALKLIEKRGEEIAQDLAPKLAEQWAKDFENRFSDLRALGLGRQEAEPLPPAPKPAWQLPWTKKPEAKPNAQAVEAEPTEAAAPLASSQNGNGHHPSQK
jgi:hypothetical protein